jgi:hypothetical protein
MMPTDCPLRELALTRRWGCLLHEFALTRRWGCLLQELPLTIEGGLQEFATRRWGCLLQEFAASAWEAGSNTAAINNSPRPTARDHPLSSRRARTLRRTIIVPVTLPSPPPVGHVSIGGPLLSHRRDRMCIARAHHSSRRSTDN